MLTIDDPEIERFIRDEAARTGEAPIDVLRRVLVVPGTTPTAPDTAAWPPFEQWPVRNGLRVLPGRPDEPPITPALVRRLLGETE